MSALDRILVIVDKRMRRTAALDRGVALARRSGAQLHLCLFDHDPLIGRTAGLVAPELMRLAKAQYLGQRQAWLAAQAASLAEHGLRVQCEVIWAPEMDEAILDKILEVSPGLVIKDMQQEPLRQRLMHSPLDLRILRHSPAPVMMVRSTTRYLPRRIAAAIDFAGAAPGFNPLNQAIVDAATGIGGCCEAEVHLVRVEVPCMALNPESLPLYEALAQVQESDRQSFRDCCRRAGIADERRHLLEGDAASELARFAQRNDVDVLVLGSACRPAIDRFLLGSTSEAVLNEVDCDVLLVKPADFAAELGRHVDLAALHRRQAAVAA